MFYYYDIFILFCGLLFDMSDLFSVFDYKVDECINIIDKTIDIHDNLRFQGFFSDIGMASGHYVNFKTPENLVIVGDIHGDFLTLEKIMTNIDFLHYLKNDSNLLIFLGDYIDRGEFSLEVLLFLCSLKNLYPNNVFMLRGNHEAHARFPFSSYDFYSHLINKFKKPLADNLYENHLLPFFESLFLICEVDEFSLLAHGGLPVIEDVDFFNNYRFHLSSVLSNSILLEEILWNDPRNLDSGRKWSFSNRGIGKYFGVDITNTWLSNTGCKFLIRGHEPCNGYKLIHDNKVMTIFSSKNPYPKFQSSYFRASEDDINRVKSDGLLLAENVHIV